MQHHIHPPTKPNTAQLQPKPTHPPILNDLPQRTSRNQHATGANSPIAITFNMAQKNSNRQLIGRENYRACGDQWSPEHLAEVSQSPVSLNSSGPISWYRPTLVIGGHCVCVAQFGDRVISRGATVSCCQCQCCCCICFVDCWFWSACGVFRIRVVVARFWFFLISLHRLK